MTLKHSQLLTIKNDVLSCNKCTARQEARLPVPWEINDIESPVLFHGRNPGIDEDMEGKPFVGRGGRVLNRNLIKNLIGRNHINIGNLIQCYTTKDRPPTLAEVRTCFHEHVLKYLDILQPKLIVLMGSATIEAYTNIETVKEAECRLMIHKRGFKMVACPHPGSVLRGGSMDRFMKSFDFCCEYVRKELYGKV